MKQQWGYSVLYFLMGKAFYHTILQIALLHIEFALVYKQSLLSIYPEVKNRDCHDQTWQAMGRNESSTRQGSLTRPTESQM